MKYRNFKYYLAKQCLPALIYIINVSRYIFVILSIEPPSIELQGRDKVTVKVADECRVSVKIAGKPAPIVTWERDGTDLETNDKLTVSKQQ